VAKRGVCSLKSCESRISAARRLTDAPIPNPNSYPIGRTVPTINQENSLLISDLLRKIREGLDTRDKRLWDEFMVTGHLNGLW